MISPITYQHKKIMDPDPGYHQVCLKILIPSAASISSMVWFGNKDDKKIKKNNCFKKDFLIRETSFELTKNPTQFLTGNVSGFKKYNFVKYPVLSKI